MDQQRPTVKSIRAKFGLTSAESETDSSALEVKLQHPVLHNNRGEIVRKLNPSSLLIDCLIQNELITKDKKQELESEMYVLGKVKLILQSVSDCDDETLLKFKESLSASDAHGNNSQLAELLSLKYSEYKNGPLG